MTAPNTETSSILREVSNNNSDGLRIGQSSTDKLGFYGLTTPIVQPTGTSAAAATTLAVSTTSNIWGFSTSTQANAIVTLVNDLRTKLVALGLIS